MIRMIVSSISLIGLTSVLWASGLTERAQVSKPMSAQARGTDISISEVMDIDRNVAEVTLAVPMQVLLAALVQKDAAQFPWVAYWKKYAAEHPATTLSRPEAMLEETTVRDAGKILAWQELFVEDHWDFSLGQNNTIFGIDAAQASSKVNIKFS